MGRLFPLSMRIDGWDRWRRAVVSTISLQPSLARTQMLAHRRNNFTESRDFGDG